MRSLCLLLPWISFLINLPFTWLLIRTANRFDLTDKPDLPPTTPSSTDTSPISSSSRKWHAKPIPNLGGIGIFWSITLPLLLTLLLINVLPSSFYSHLPAAIHPHLPGIQQQTPGALALIACLAALHILGIIDDRKRLAAWPKLLVQIFLAAILVIGFQFRILEALETWYGMAGTLLSILLSIFWILAITNAMNFLDNMDGLSAGIGTIATAIYLAINLLHGQWFVASLAALLLGALVAFLVFNFPPARIFMGDSGSLVLGFLLALISIKTTYYQPNASTPALGHPSWYGALTPLIVLAVPLYDITSVTFIRLSQGKSPFQGDRNHFSHRLVRQGRSQRAAVFIIWLCTVATGLGGLLLPYVQPWQAILIACQTAATLTVLALLEKASPSPPSP